MTFNCKSFIIKSKLKISLSVSYEKPTKRKGRKMRTRKKDVIKKRFDFTVEMALSEIVATRYASDYIEAVCQLQELIEVGYRVKGYDEFNWGYKYSIKFNELYVPIAYEYEFNDTYVLTHTPKTKEELMENIKDNIEHYVEVPLKNSEWVFADIENDDIEIDIDVVETREWVRL